VICAAGSPSAEPQARTILVVDDDRAVTETLGRLLTNDGFLVATALDPEVGLTLADNVRPDAVVLDLRMPLVNGLHFLRQLRRMPHLADVPVVIVTGDYFVADHMERELLTLGAEIRFKPIQIDELVALLRTLIHP